MNINIIGFFDLRCSFLILNTHYLTAEVKLLLRVGLPRAVSGSQQLSDGGQHDDSQRDGQKEGAEERLKVLPTPNTHCYTTETRQ